MINLIIVVKISVSRLKKSKQKILETSMVSSKCNLRLIILSGLPLIYHMDGFAIYHDCQCCSYMQIRRELGLG